MHRRKGAEAAASGFHFTPSPRADWASLAVSAAGMDASAQTGSHELTIPNDVSPRSAPEIEVSPVHRSVG